MNWETLYCPNRSCPSYGRPFDQGLLVKNGSSHGKKQALQSREKAGVVSFLREEGVLDLRNRLL